MILTHTSRVFSKLLILAMLVALPPYLSVEAQRQQDNRALVVAARRLVEQQCQQLPLGESQQEYPGQPQQQHRVSCCSGCASSP
jgi:hypothetical protein